MPRPWEWDVDLPANPNVEQLKKQAKELVKAIASEDPAAAAFVRAHRPKPSETFRLSDAQFVLARSLGAPSWPALMNRLDGNGAPPPVEAPLVPVRGIVVFPGGRVPLYIGRPSSLAAVDVAAKTDGYLVCAAQREPRTEAPKPSDLHQVGTLCRIVAVHPIPDKGTMKVAVEGVTRVALDAVELRDAYLRATIRPLAMPDSDADADAIWRAAVQAFEAFAEQHHAISHRAVVQVRQAKTARSALGLLLQHVHPLTVPIQQQLLEARDPVAGLSTVAEAFRNT